jgi:hypothetical protein
MIPTDEGIQIDEIEQWSNAPFAIPESLHALSKLTIDTV